MERGAGDGDEASVLGALIGPSAGGSLAGLQRRDSGSSFRSSRMGPLDDMVLESGLQVGCPAPGLRPMLHRTAGLVGCIARPGQAMKHLS